MKLSFLCPICNAPKTTDAVICNKCKEQLDSECFDSFMSRCPKCFYPKIHGPYLCERCENQSAHRVFPVARYDGALTYSILYSFKFHGHREMASVIAFYLMQAITVLDPENKAIIIPIPCSNAHLSKYGWDHMVEVCKALNRPYIELLVNADEREVQQKRLKRIQRVGNSEARFKLNPVINEINELKNKRLIVVDDIVTTMSTMNSAISVLEDNGFNDVCGASWLCEL